MQQRPTPGPDDPVLAKRAAILKWSELGQRVAYMCFGASVVIFVIAFIVQFPSWMVTVIVGLLLVGSVVFIPAVVLSYGAKAADKEEAAEAAEAARAGEEGPQRPARRDGR